MTDFRMGSARDETADLLSKVGEFLIYDADISDADRTSLETYLKDKWGF